MLVETGLVISLTKRSLLSSLAQQGGVLTASLAGGEILVERLRDKAGFTIKVLKSE